MTTAPDRVLETFGYRRAGSPRTRRGSRSADLPATIAEADGTMK
jgi:hypothetical protein